MVRSSMGNPRILATMKLTALIQLPDTVLESYAHANSFLRLRSLKSHCCVSFFVFSIALACSALTINLFAVLLSEYLFALDRFCTLELIDLVLIHLSDVFGMKRNNSFTRICTVLYSVSAVPWLLSRRQWSNLDLTSSSRLSLIMHSQQDN